MSPPDSSRISNRVISFCCVAPSVCLISLGFAQVFGTQIAASAFVVLSLLCLNIVRQILSVPDIAKRSSNETLSRIVQTRRNDT